ncbi:hypothetical protein HanPSC8_Chr10g0418721 [Helianthus annuus]|nr:hypothetical protein HanPSC8_Chr10g0418721 [Helianthus annuus]
MNGSVFFYFQMEVFLMVLWLLESSLTTVRRDALVCSMTCAIVAFATNVQRFVNHGNPLNRHLRLIATRIEVTRPTELTSPYKEMACLSSIFV